MAKKVREELGIGGSGPSRVVEFRGSRQPAPAGRGPDGEDDPAQEGRAVGRRVGPEVGQEGVLPVGRDALRQGADQPEPSLGGGEITEQSRQECHEGHRGQEDPERADQVAGRELGFPTAP